MSQLWIGPLGGLVPFPEIENGKDLAAGDELVGGDHVSLTGASTTDVLAFKRRWSASWDLLDVAEVTVLRAAHRGNLGGSGLWLVETDSEPNLLPTSARTVFGFPRAAVPEPGLLDAGEVVPVSGSATSATVPLLKRSGTVLAVSATARLAPGLALTLQAVRADGTTAASVTTSNAGSTTTDVRADSMHLNADTAVAWRLAVTGGLAAGTASHVMLALGTDVQPWGPPGQSGRVTVTAASVSRKAFGVYSGTADLKQR